MARQERVCPGLRPGQRLRALFGGHATGERAAGALDRIALWPRRDIDEGDHEPFIAFDEIARYAEAVGMENAKIVLRQANVSISATKPATLLAGEPAIYG